MNKNKIKYFAWFLVVFISIVFVMEYSGKLIYPIKYKEYVFKYSQQNKIDPYLVLAIMKAESNFDPKATSRKNAKGLMQITDGTGRWGAESIGMEDFSVANLYEPETNIAIGCWYLSWLMKAFDGNVDLVIAAYNGGSGRVNEWLKNRNYSSSGESLHTIPFKETSLYVKKVKNYYVTYKKLYE